MSDNGVMSKCVINLNVLCFVAAPNLFLYPVKFSNKMNTRTKNKLCNVKKTLTRALFGQH